MIFGLNALFSQQISIDNNIPLQQLVENNLANGCVEISNVTSSVNGSVDGITSYGAFQSGSSNFPLSNGIVLSTGNAAAGANSANSTELSDGTSNWGSDSDIESFMGLGSMVNATVIEFDFVALTDMVQFNYLLASEEYFANYPCRAYDGFVFLIRETSSAGPYNNIALIPGAPSGTDEVSVRNIRDAIPSQCLAENNQYFDGYSLGDTNYNGRTTVLTAGTSVIPNVMYHVKLVVAESNDSSPPLADTAVFIEANTFTELELGADIDTCSGSVTLDGEIQNPLATYEWFRDNNLISGENNPTLTTSLSGLYRVEISIAGNSCVIQDEVNVTIDTELATDPISPYQLCDSDGNGQEFFDLTTKNAEVENAIQNLPANYSIRYYLSDNDARNNPSNNVTSLTSNSRTIFVRVEDTVDGCLIYGTFELIVNPLPTSTQPSPLDVCDNDSLPNSSTAIDLSQKDNEITGGDPDLFVTYHFTQIEANTGANPVPQPYFNTNPSETLYIRVINNSTGCAVASGNTLTINVTNGNTGIIRNTQYIDACDMDHDGSATFDLTQVLNDILNGETGFLPPTYHTSYQDAETGNNPIPNPQSYVNAEPDEQIIYLRLVDSSTGCYAIVPIEIHTNLLLTGTNIPATGFAFCDQDADGQVDVFLNTIENVIANGLPNVMVTYYETESDRDGNSNPIDTSNAYTIFENSPVTLYLRIENGLCTEVSEVILRVNPVVTFTPVAPIPYCDTDDDGFTIVDFDTFDDTITGGIPDFNVRYFDNQAAADTGVGSLPQFYGTGSGTYWARIENNITGCYTVNSFDIEVIPAPTVMQPSDMVICNNSTSTTANIRLEDKVSEIVSDASGLVIEFFTDLGQAESFDSSSPANNLNKQSFDASTQIIYVRIESTDATACYNIVSFNVLVNTVPVIPSIPPYQICVDAGTTDADFYFQNQDAQILSGQTGKEVFYFQDAAFTIPLDKTMPYNSTGSETIYVRVENVTDPDCNATSSFLLEIGTNPNYNQNFTDFPPDCQNEALTRTYDMDGKRQEIASGSTDVLDIQFYLDESDAINGNSNSLPDSYDSDELQGQFYARIENTANSCFVIEEVRFITFPKPVLSSAVINPVCDTDYDGNVTFDLTTAIFQVDNVRFGGVTYRYFEDAALSVEIPTSQLTIYAVSGTSTIYVEVETDTGCTDASELELPVNLPPTLLTVGTMEDCFNTSNLYDLSQVDSFVAHSSSNVNISYHDSQLNSEGNTGIYAGKSFSYSSPGTYPIFVRVEDADTSCLAFTSFNLIISSIPVANTPPNLIGCDDDTDTMLQFDLTENNDDILGGQNATNFSIYYYNNDLANAENDVNRLDNFHNATNGEIIYARIENNNTGCFSTTQFQIIVNALPIIPLNDIESVCVNDLPKTLIADTGNPGDTYLWWTGETTPEIDVDLTDLGPNRWVEVTTAAPQSCPLRRNFELIQSVEATIDATATADFTDPNTITVTVSGFGDYRYVLDGGEPQTSNVFSNVSLGPHIVTIIDLNGCEPVETDVFVIDIPKFVTPNNDGAFDTWHIVGIDRLPGTLVYVYNRHGKLIKMLPHTSIGWDGTFNGQNMPSDDYWFSADIIHNGESFNIRGHFALKR